MPEPCKSPPLDSCHERFLRTHKEADLAPDPVVGLELQVRDTEKFPHVLGSKAFIHSKQGPCFRAVQEDRGDKRPAEPELACKADGVSPADPV